MINVLLVDDKFENLVSLETLLKRENDNINYILCRSGEAALKAAIKEDIALILLDVQMPNMDGFEVARLLKNNSKTSAIPIIFVTAIDRDIEDVLHGFESGGVDFLFKPLHPSITKAKVNAFIKIYLQNKELQQKNRLLKEKQQIIEETHQLAGIGTWEWNLAKDEIYFSKTLATIFGFEAGTGVPANHYLSTLYPLDRHQMKTLVEIAKSRDGYLFYDYRFSINGQTLYMVGKFKAERDENNNVIKLIGYSQNVSSLRASQALLERIFDVSPNAICTYSAIRNEEGEIIDFRIVRANKAVEKIIGRSMEELTGKTLLSEFPGTRSDGLFDRYVRVVEANEVVDMEHFYRHEGIKAWFYILAVKLDDGFVLTYNDISQRKKAEEALRKAHEELAKAHQSLLQLNNELEERVKGRTKELQKAETELRQMNENLLRINEDHNNFIYTASHDLKAPINNIEGLMIFLKKHLPLADTNVARLVTMIEESITRFKTILKELTEVSKLENIGNQEIEEIEFKPLIEEARLNIKEQMEITGAKIVEQLEAPSVRFSRKNLRSILYNLISNAIKYRSPERQPEVIIQTRTTNKNFTLLLVQDNGLGIQKEDIPKMFGMFKRLHHHVEGTGVGLYLVRKIVENAGGKIEVESEFGKGTAFKIYFPNDNKY